MLTKINNHSFIDIPTALRLVGIIAGVWIAQLEINAREAHNPSLFVAGWRPFFGWCGGIAFLYSTILQPILVWYGTSKGWQTPPEINMDLLWVVITGMLGICGLRSIEKVKGVARK